MYNIKKLIRPDKNIYNNDYFFKTPKEYYKQAVILALIPMLNKDLY